MIRKSINFIFVISFLIIDYVIGGSIRFANYNTISQDSNYQKALFIFAHQDDDAFISATIKSLLSHNDSVFIVWTCKSYQGDSTYGDRRISEAICAMKYLGLDSNSYKFLNYPDMYSFKYIPKLINNIKNVISSFKPTVIYIQAYEMGNMDHDVAHFCTVQASNELDYRCDVLEIPQYSAYNISNL